jgi:hypothetical protein
MSKMPFIYDDGGRAAAGFRGSAGDCGVRAIAIAAELPYAGVYETMTALLHEMKVKNPSPRNGLPMNVMKEYMRILGWSWTPTMLIGSGCTVHLAPGELPEGRIICRVSKHFVAVINGVIYDTHDCGERGVTVYPPGSRGPIPKGARELPNGAGWAYEPQRCVYGYWKEL